MYLRHDLHAKFFAGDDKCLIGSANVTDTGLGWRTPASLELLTPVSRTLGHVVEFENELLSGAVRATSIQRDHLKKVVEKLSKTSMTMSITGVDEITTGQLPPSWIPQSRNPEELYSVYCGNSDISSSVLQVMEQDLEQIGTIAGLDEEGFRMWIAAVIIQAPLIERVIYRIENEGQVTEQWLSGLLTTIGVDTRKYQAREVLEVLKRWFTYFLPTQYETAQDSIKLVKARTL